MLGSSRVVAVPNTTLQLVQQSKTYDPRTVGSDGAVYARMAASPDFDRMVRSTDGFATVESGFDFTGVSGSENMIWCTRTTDGYVAITRDTAADTGHVWFSTSFTTGFTSVLTMRGTQLLAIAPPTYPLNGGSAVLLVGEYQTAVYPSSASKLWASFDGGQTWSTIRTMTPTNTSVNNHWHNACYDPHTHTIWASGGDGVNSHFAYSTDLGSSWTNVTIPSDAAVYDGNPIIQPTLCMPFRHQISICPDRGPLFTGIWDVDKGTGFVRPSAVVAQIRTDQQYGSGPHAYYGYDEAYVVYSPTGSTSDTAYYFATGDGGKSWWKVAEIALAGGSVSGVVGVDALGNVYSQAFLRGASRILVAPKLTWTWRSI